MISRRGLITGLGALIAAPAIVRAGSLMPVRVPALIVPVQDGVWGPMLSAPNWTIIQELTREVFYDGPLLKGTLGEYGGIIFREMTRQQLAEEFPATPSRA